MSKFSLILIITSSLGLLFFGRLMDRLAVTGWPHGVHTGSGVTKPNLAMELVRSRADVATILGGPGTSEGRLRRCAMQKIQYFDMLFIGCYLCLFIAIGVSLTLIPGRSNHSLAYTTITVISAAGLFDFLEDWSILQVIKMNSAVPELVPIRGFALCKWGLFFLGSPQKTEIIAR